MCFDPEVLNQMDWLYQGYHIVCSFVGLTSDYITSCIESIHSFNEYTSIMWYTAPKMFLNHLCLLLICMYIFSASWNYACIFSLKYKCWIWGRLTDLLLTKRMQRKSWNITCKSGLQGTVTLSCSWSLIVSVCLSFPLVSSHLLTLPAEVSGWTVSWPVERLIRQGTECCELGEWAQRRILA